MTFQELNLYTVQTNHVAAILSRLEIDYLMKHLDSSERSNYSIISIAEPDEHHINIPDGFNDSIQLYFSDIRKDIDSIRPKSQKEAEQLAQLKSFEISNQQITDIVKFIQKNKNSKFIVQCSAGISRSSAIALLIHDLLDSSQKKDIISFPKYSPNKIIYHKISDFLLNTDLV